MTTRTMLTACVLAVAAVTAWPAAATAQHSIRRSIDGRPDAIVDLRTAEGVAVVKGQWRSNDVGIVDAAFMAPGPDLRPSATAVMTRDLATKAGGIDFDDSAWPTIDPSALETRRANGKLSFNWYRINVTIPEQVAGFETTGSTVVFEIVVDDYAEVWVDGNLPRTLGQSGGALIKGFNAPNRVVLTRNAQPNQKIQLAVFGANGPLSDPPSNYIWIRSATLDFYRTAGGPSAPLQIIRADSGLDAIVPPNAKIEKLADGFLFTEGPVWVPAAGYLLFSDPNANTIYRWSEDDGLSVFRTKSGYTGFDIGQYGQPGSNGLALDREGRLTINEHGNRRVTRLEKNGALTVLADRFGDKRLNSPNDLVYKSDGSLYFTDPPFGLPKFFDDSRKELPFSGIYRLAAGKLHLESKDLTGPNGLAFSPDERYLYVGNWDEKKKVVMRYSVEADGSLSNGSVFFDLTRGDGEDAIDGLKVDRAGNVYISGPGGLWIVSPDGRHLGTIVGSEHPHNFAWGDADGKTLYLTARSGLYRVRLQIPGAGLSWLAGE